MTKEKSTFDTITPKLILGQLYKSTMIMRIVSLKTQSANISDLAIKYADELLTLTDKLAELHFSITGKKELDEVPSSKYIDPIMHLSDVIYYLEGQSKHFKSSAEQSVIDCILVLMHLTKSRMLMV